MKIKPQLCSHMLKDPYVVLLQRVEWIMHQSPCWVAYLVEEWLDSQVS